VVDQFGNYPIACNLNEFLATFVSIRECSDVASICTWTVVVQQVYIDGK
jgi:hypothetical protein